MKKKNAAPVFDPDLPRCWIEWRMVHGMIELHFYSPNWLAPIGSMWAIVAGRGNTSAPSVDIVHCQVIEWARRMGVCRRFHEWLFNAWEGRDRVEVIRTADGSKHGGRQTVLGLGYKHDARSGMWILTRKALRK